MKGRREEARKVATRSKHILDELGARFFRALSSHPLAEIELLAGDPTAAEAELRQACTQLERLGEKSGYSTTTATLAGVLYELRKYEEAEDFVQISRSIRADDDLLTQSLWRAVQAKLLARRGEAQTALGLARAAVQLLIETDTYYRANVLTDLGSVLSMTDRSDEAAAVFRQAERIHSEKGNIVSAGRARKLLEELTTSTPPGDG